jgi:hypothetical protein
VISSFEAPYRRDAFDHRLSGNQVLCFVHIPKTAGLTLRPVLDSRFRLEEVCPAATYPAFTLLPESALSAYRLVRGHFWFNIGERLPLKPVYMTMLRDPIERTLSQFEFTRRNQENGTLYEMVRRMTLEEYLRDEYICEETLRDVQSRFIAPGTQPVDDSVFMPASFQGLASAKANLERAAFVGLVERFDDSLRLLTHTFGWRPVRRVERLNTSSGRIQRTELPAHIIDRIIELNENDLELYEFAKRLFERRIADMTEELLWRSYADSYRDLEPRDRVRVSADEPWDGDGWHPPERDAGGAFRWMSHASAILDLPLSATSDTHLRARVANFVSPDILATLTATVNAATVELKSKIVNGEIIVFGMIPRAALSVGRPFARIQFSIKWTSQPRQDAGPDDRKLGVAFSWVEVTPKE